MKLFGHPDSGHAYKIRLCLKLANIDHEYTVIDIWSARDSRPQEFQKNSRFQEVPLLIDEGHPYVQSNAILCHVAQKYNILGAQEPRLFSQCQEWLFWEANKIGMCLPQILSHYKFPQYRLNQGALDWLMLRYEHDIRIMDHQLSDGRNYFLGDELSIADFSLCGYLFWAKEAHIILPENVERWLKNIRHLPNWQEPLLLLSQSEN